MNKKIVTFYKLTEQECQMLRMENMKQRKPQIYMNETTVIAWYSDGSITVLYNPQNYDFSGWKSVAKISCGKKHIVALFNDGTAAAAGDNKFGQCDVAAWQDIVDIAAFDNMTVGLSVSGEAMIKGTASPSDTPDLSAAIKVLNDNIIALKHELNKQQQKTEQLEKQLKKLLSTSADTENKIFYNVPIVYNVPDKLTSIKSDSKIVYNYNSISDKKAYKENDKYVGKRLDGRYEIQELIGIGSIARVYKAYDNTDNKTVAIKIFDPVLLGNEDFIKSFDIESLDRALLCSHPNIARVYDISFGDRIQYIVMEYINGVTLRKYIDYEKTISFEQALYLTVHILQALEYANEKGLIHHDLKPMNIMLQQDGTVKITDFGFGTENFSFHITSDSDKYHSLAKYISPEQARGGKTDEKSEVYSVGIILYEMLTGRCPFEADSAVAIALMQLQNDPTPPRELNKDIPPVLEQIILKAMNKSPDDRFTIRIMISLLKAIIENPQKAITVNDAEKLLPDVSYEEKEQDSKPKRAKWFHKKLF